MRRGRLAVAAAALAASVAVPPAVAATGGHGCRSADWPEFGRDPAHTFAVPAGCSPITPTSVATLVPAWFVHTKDSVTASPAVVGGVVYVGTWDGTFYAVDAATGAVRWTFRISAHAASAFGRIVSSADVVTVPDAGGHPRRVVLFGGGSTLWALDAATGHLLASADLDPRTPADRARQDASSSPPVVEIESSPVLATVGHTRTVFVGMDVHNQPHVGRTGLVALALEVDRSGRWRLRPLWKYDVETGRTYRGAAGLTVGSGQGLGCGGVWSSPAVDPAAGLVLFGTASCSYPEQARAAGENDAESMVALHVATGRLAWRYRPGDDLPTAAQRVGDAHRDADFGASPNLFRIGDRAVVGEGRKDARYYVRDERTGVKVSTTVAGQPGELQSDFAVGGFLGTTAVAPGPGGMPVVVGGTAIPLPHSAQDLDKTTWAVRGMDPRTGTVRWVYRLAGPTYGHTSIVDGVAFVPDTTTSSLLALDVADGRLLWVAPVVGPPSSTAVVVGDSVYLGTGTRETDLEYKAVSDKLQDAFAGTIGASPLSPVSGIQAFRLLASSARR